MNNEQSKSNKVGTIELALEMNGVEAILAGLEQIKVAAQEAAAAVASIGAPEEGKSDAARCNAAYAAAFAEQWVRDLRDGRDSCGMVPRTVTEFIAELSKLGAAQ
ncbi:MAG: hypothetical protein ACXW2U_05380 [Telluria sp.]